MCPLYKAELVDLNGAFVRGVNHIGRILSEDEESFEFLFELSRTIDEEVNQLVDNLKKIIN